MAVEEKWYFTKEQLLQSPSRKSGYDVDKELSCRQQAANFIQDMGQRLQVSQLCINTAIVYMHRFYVFHSLAAFHRNAIAAAALFLAAKVEEQPRKLEHVIKVAHMCLHRENPNLDTKSEVYLEQAQDLVFNENVLLQTLGFDVAIDHPHTHVVRCCHLVRASKDLAQTSYFMASNSLHLTTMCLQYKPTVVACFCIHLACKWSNWEIPRSNEGKDWFWYIDKTVTIDLLEQLTAEFLAILDKCPTKLKRKMMSMNQNNTPGFTQQSVSHDGLQFEEPRKLTGSEAIKPPEGLFAVQKTNSQASSDKPGTSTSAAPLPAHAHHQKIDYREYREKKERERIEREKQQQQRDSHNASSSSNHHHHNHHHHHSKANVMPNKPHGNVQSRTSSGSVSHKSFQQPPHGMQANLHFQNLKENRDSNSQTFQSSASSKDSNYLKQHPPHTEREGNKDNATFHGQYSQNSNLQHQSYPHKSESNYSGNYSHREGNRGNHGIQGSSNSNLPQVHHSQNQNITASSTNLANNQKEYLMGGQRDSASGKDMESQSQPLVKGPTSSSIRDIISQAVSQKDVHSMTNERKEHLRDKSRMNFIHGSSSTSNYRPETVKSGREQAGLNLHESTDRKMDEFALKLKEKSLKKGEEEPVIDAVKMEPPHVKAEKFDESEAGDENGSTWSLSNVKSEKSYVPVAIKSETISGKNELSVDLSKLDSYASNSDSNKSQSVHSTKMYDSKYKTHHYHSSIKNSEVPQVKTEKPGVQCSSELHKKIGDRSHEKHRKVQQPELERIPDGGGANSGDVSKHHKLGKETSDKSKLLLSGQQGDQRLKEKMSPSLYQKIRSMPRPSGMGYAKSESGHLNADVNFNSNSNNASERGEIANQPVKSFKSIGPEDAGRNSNVFQRQKSHEFGSSSIVQDSSATKIGKTSSIFSPDSKIPPQNILTSLEKDSKKSSSSAHRSHSSSSNKTPPNSTKKMASSIATTSATGSLFSPPLPKNVPSIPARHRTPSSGSEPELIPVLTKIEETPGYENIIRERKIALTSTNEILSGAEKEKKSSLPSDKSDGGNAFLVGSEQKNNSKDNKTSSVKSDAIGQAKSMANVKFSNEIRSDLGAVIYPTNPKSLPASKSSQGFSSLSETKHSLADSVSTVNLLGIEKMVDTSISPVKQSNQFDSTNSIKHGGGSFNATNSSTNAFGSSSKASTTDQTDKLIIDQTPGKTSNNAVPNQEMIDVDVLGYTEKKKSEKKKKKEKHKHKEKDKDKSERKKEKKKHKSKDKDRTKEKDRYKEEEKHKDKERHREKDIDVVSSEIPIKITIPKDKISGSLKFKISKDCIKKDEPDSLKSNTSGELKIKISKDVISSLSAYKEESKSESSSKKRERSPKSGFGDQPHPKSMKTQEKKSSTGSSSTKSNGTEAPSRNSSSHRYSVSENGSCFDISSLYDFPFDFEENGQGIIKTPDYDFEALNASKEIEEFEDVDEDDDDDDGIIKNSHNESRDDGVATTIEPETNAISFDSSEICDVDVSCGDDIPADELVLKPISPLKEIDSLRSSFLSNEEEKSNLNDTVDITSTKTSPLESHSEMGKRKDENQPTENNCGENFKKCQKQLNSIENCEVLKNYKTILDSHSRRCDSEMTTQRVSPSVSKEARLQGFTLCPEGNTTTSTSSTTLTPTTTTTTTTETISNNDDNNNKNNNTSSTSLNSERNSLKSQSKMTCSDSENPNYYNKYFKRDGGSRIRAREEKRPGKGRADEKDNRFDDKQRYHEGRRYNRGGDYVERDRRDDRRFHRDHSKDSSQYYYDRKDDRRFDYPGGYPSNQYFNPGKPDVSLNYNMNAADSAAVSSGGTPAAIYPTACSQTKSVPQQFPQGCESAMSTNSNQMNVQYQYGYFNNYLYPNGGYRFYGNVPFVNMSLIQQQQPIPPGTGDSFVQVEPPPLPLEPPPDLPPPPETPPPLPKSDFVFQPDAM